MGNVSDRIRWLGFCYSWKVIGSAHQMIADGARPLDVYQILRDLRSYDHFCYKAAELQLTEERLRTL